MHASFILYGCLFNNLISDRVNYTDLLIDQNHAKYLVPACEMFDVPIVLIFLTQSVKNALWQKFNYLRENIFNIIHKTNFLVFELRISNRHAI